MRGQQKLIATLRITCPDRRGIVAAIAEFLYRNHANILHSDQHQDAEYQLFVMRTEFDLDHFALSPEEFPAAFEKVAKPFQMDWRISYNQSRQKMAILVSKQDHCLADLLYRHRCGELQCDIPLVMGNHPDVESLVSYHGIPFFYLPIDPKSPESKREVERQQLALIREHGVDLLVLARYMQILSPEFVREFPSRMINIHHSFLPAFVGPKPYHRAFDRGVKLIGATSHYVTEVLDDGPIIDQDVIRVSHRDTVDQLVEKGKDMERVVLSRAVRWHLDGRVIVYGNKTVIFD